MDNFVGKRFGRLSVLERVEDHVTTGGRKLAAYSCICDCGNRKTVLADKLRNGRTRSCGCITREKAKDSIKNALNGSVESKRKRREELIGKKFGNFTVLSIDGIDNNGLYLARCQCDCGEVKLITINSLLRGRSTQCKSCQLKDLQKNFKVNEMVEGTALCKLTQNKRCDNTSGVKGVYVEKRTGKFVAEIRLKGKKYWIGKYSCLEDAKKAREQAEQELFDPILEKYGRPTTESMRMSMDEMEVTGDADQPRS